MQVLPAFTTCCEARFSWIAWLVWLEINLDFADFEFDFDFNFDFDCDSPEGIAPNFNTTNNKLLGVSFYIIYIIIYIFYAYLVNTN